MLMYGNADVRGFDPFFTQHGLILNLTTYREEFYKLAALIPPKELGYSTGLDFDLNYANYIMNNNYPFCEMFIIIYSLYSNKDIYLLVDETVDWCENITESLLKLIQQRYGINSVLVKSEEDYIYAQMSAVDSFASGPCLWNFDVDKERFSGLMTDYITKFGNPPIQLDGFSVKDLSNYEDY